MGQNGGLAPARLQDLLAAEYKGRVLISDPRTSSPGFQFLYWVIKSKGEEAGFQFLKELFLQAPSTAAIATIIKIYFFIIN